MVGDQLVITQVRLRLAYQKYFVTGMISYDPKENHFSQHCVLHRNYVLHEQAMGSTIEQLTINSLPGRPGCSEAAIRRYGSQTATKNSNEL